MMQIKTDSVESTIKVAKCLGQVLNPGDIVWLTGDLGAGKTAFAGGIAKQLGVSGYVTSPTFTLVNEYEGKIPIFHFDVYRIEDPEEMFEIGLEEYLYSKGIILIEWADLIKTVLRQDRISVDISMDVETCTDMRKI